MNLLLLYQPPFTGMLHVIVKISKFRPLLVSPSCKNGCIFHCGALWFIDWVVELYGMVDFLNTPPPPPPSA